jgi:uncharacterized protein (DUF1684 family)
MTHLLDLADYRRRVFAMYAAAREGDDESAWRAWRRERDELFRAHPQSPLTVEDRASFSGLPFFDHRPEWRLEAEVELLPEADQSLAHSGEGHTRFVKFGEADVRGERLSLFWLNEYGGGVFLPFCDATNGETTYGGGRYLLDTVKGADLGGSGTRLILDFNYSYHPSCAYNPFWSCPLAPPENRLTVAVAAGERLSGSAAQPLPSITVSACGSSPC